MSCLKSIPEEAAVYLESEHDKLFKRTSSAWVYVMGRRHTSPASPHDEGQSDDEDVILSQWRYGHTEQTTARNTWKDNKEKLYFSFQNEVVERLEPEAFRGTLLRLKGNKEGSLLSFLLSQSGPESTRSHPISKKQAIGFVNYVIESARKGAAKLGITGRKFRVDEHFFYVRPYDLFPPTSNRPETTHFSWQGVLRFPGNKWSSNRFRKLPEIEAALETGAVYFLQTLFEKLLQASEKSFLQSNLFSPFLVKPPPRFSFLDQDSGSKEAEADTSEQELRKFALKLPKADLHRHIGTSITLKTIIALALNTCSYTLSVDRDPDCSGCMDCDHVAEESLKRISAALLRLVDFCPRCQGTSSSKLRRDEQRMYAEALWKAVHKNVSDPPEFPRQSSNVYDEITSFLMGLENRPIEFFEIQSMLVAGLAVYSCMARDHNPSDLAMPWSIPEENDTLKGSTYCVLMQNKVQEIHNNWRRKIVVTEAAKFNMSSEDAWNNYIRGRRTAAVAASEVIRAEFRRELNAKNLSLCPHISLEKLITLPVVDLLDMPDRTLLRYLWGCDLLGSAHLQYPENLVLAAYDLVAEAAAENVLYTELRCAPVGYTGGGMTARQATDLLCKALDVASASHASSKDTWIRFSILVGGKRHKPEEELNESIQLLNSYLKDGSRSYCTDATGCKELEPQSWWEPCTVVGFDLSGQEGSSLPTEGYRRNFLADKLQPLFKESCFITIHAGEAASADSIWEAVYRMGARRIGHGLRLRENSTLLEYCITEGICLELCPTSNRYTNLFDENLTSKRTTYPLEDFMGEGLQVCLGTDNPQIHPEADRGIVAEYLSAWKLSGKRLNQWHFVLLARAGLKNAFLPESQVDQLLEEFARQVYQMVHDEEKFGDFPINQLGEIRKDAKRFTEISS